MTVAAALLVVSGGATVTVGVLNQDADPPSPAVTATGDPGAVPSAGVGALDPALEPRILPAEIRIPSIGVTSDVTTVGLNPDGSLEVPQPGADYDKAAWYRGSPTPGQRGPAVIEGHVDSAKNGPSVFYDLGRVAAGDTVEIVRKDGSVLVFVVDAVETFPKDDFPTLTVYGNTDRPELRLITCGGEFDSARGHYLNNTVVFAHQVRAADAGRRGHGSTPALG